MKQNKVYANSRLKWTGKPKYEFCVTVKFWNSRPIIEDPNHFRQWAYSLNQVLQEYETEALPLFKLVKFIINFFLI